MYTHAQTQMKYTPKETITYNILFAESAAQ